MKKGVLCGLAAGALWALTYFLPLYISSFTPLEVSLGRYVFYGVFSAICWKRGTTSLADVPRWIKVRCMQFALFAFIGFYVLHVTAIHLIGAGFATLAIAFLPISIALYGNFVHREFPFSIFVLPLIAISVGLVSIHITDLSFDSDSSG